MQLVEDDLTIEKSKATLTLALSCINKKLELQGQMKAWNNLKIFSTKVTKMEQLLKIKEK